MADRDARVVGQDHAQVGVGLVVEPVDGLVGPVLSVHHGRDALREGHAQRRNARPGRRGFRAGAPARSVPPGRPTAVPGAGRQEAHLEAAGIRGPQRPKRQIVRRAPRIGQRQQAGQVDALQADVGSSGHAQRGGRNSGGNQAQSGQVEPCAAGLRQQFLRPAQFKLNEPAEGVVEPGLHARPGPRPVADGLRAAPGRRHASPSPRPALPTRRGENRRPASSTGPGPAHRPVGPPHATSLPGCRTERGARRPGGPARTGRRPAHAARRRGSPAPAGCPRLLLARGR